MVDFRGQKVVEDASCYIMFTFAAVAWVVGYVQQNFMFTIYGWGIGTLVTAIVCLPDWPVFNQHPVSWLPSLPEYHDAYSPPSGTLRRNQTTRGGGARDLTE